MVPVPPPLANRLSSGDTATEYTRSLCPSNGSPTNVFFFHVPNLQGPILWSDDSSTIFEECESPHFLSVHSHHLCWRYLHLHRRRAPAHNRKMGGQERLELMRNVLWSSRRPCVFVDLISFLPSDTLGPIDHWNHSSASFCVYPFISSDLIDAFLEYVRRRPNCGVFDKHMIR